MHLNPETRAVSLMKEMYNTEERTRINKKVDKRLTPQMSRIFEHNLISLWWDDTQGHYFALLEASNFPEAILAQA